MSLEIYQFNALSDNYGYLLHDKSTGATAAVDTPEASVVPAEPGSSQRTLARALLTPLPPPGCCHRAGSVGEGVEADAHSKHAPPP